MMKCFEKKMNEMLDYDSSRYSIELKIDGTRTFWVKDKLLSDRMVDKTLKFKHISDILKRLNAILDGEVYAGFGKTVFDITSKKGWRTAKYCVFDILELDGKDLRNLCLRDRQIVLKGVLDKLNNSTVHFPAQFPDVDTAWDFIERNRLEGLVIKDLNSSYSFKDIFDVDRSKNWIKVKDKKECVEEVVDYEKGTYKGTFILKSGNRLGNLKPELAELFLSLKNTQKIFAEICYLNKTPSGKYFQQTLKRLITEKGDVLYG